MCTREPIRKRVCRGTPVFSWKARTFSVTPERKLLKGADARFCHLLVLIHAATTDAYRPDNLAVALKRYAPSEDDNPPLVCSVEAKEWLPRLGLLHQLLRAHFE